MNNLVFYIGLGLGLAVAAGMRPFAPALLAGALGSAHALSVSFAHGRYHFLQSSWWLAAMGVALVLAYVLQLRIGSERFNKGSIGAVLTGLGIGVGAVLFAGTLADHGDPSWPGLIAGALTAGLGGLAIAPVINGARARLDDRSAREALTLYLDGVALLLAALVALLHPLGYVAVVLLLWLVAARRRRSGEKYAGLRILRRQ
jgi:hypothetical protein